MLRPSLTLPIVALALFSCADRAPKNTNGPPKADPWAGLAGPQRLAFTAPDGSSPIDRTLIDLQAKARLDPGKVDHWVELGRAFVTKARQSSDPRYYASADACAAIALERKPGYPLALSLRGMVLMNDHQFGKAREVAEAALKVDPDDLIASSILADALVELGEIHAATKVVDHMMELKPSLPSYSRFAYLRWLHGDVATAKEAYRNAIDAGLGARDPEPSAWVLSDAARMFLLAGDYAGAEAGFDRALALVPDFPPALIGKARARLALGSATEAATLARRALDKSPTAEVAWLWADAARAAGDAGSARMAVEMLKRLGKHDRRTLSLFLSTEGEDPDEALRLIEEEQKTRGDLYTRDALAFALYRSGRVERAQEEMKKAVALGTRDPMLLYHAGAIALAAKDIPRGVKLLEEALSMSPHFQAAGSKHARALLAEHRTSASR